MAGDIGIQEQVVILPESASMAAAIPAVTTAKSRVIHVYGPRVMVAEAPPEAQAALTGTLETAVITGEADAIPTALRASLTPVERLGIDALALRQSPSYISAKASRPHADQAWDSGVAQMPACHDIAMRHAEALAPAGAPTSARLSGSVAVGIIIVEGPTQALQFSEAERVKVVAEVQNGLGWLASQSPEGVTWVYDIQIVSLSTQPGADNLSSDQKEALWRDPAMAKLGFGAGMTGVTDYVESLRGKFSTTWTYCTFFTKYPLGWFAYASIGGPRLVMDYNNDGWGPDNIDRVFAHESGHIFGAPDEYASSGCSCGGSWGYYGKPNGNCANCAPNGGVDCLMKQNSWAMCTYTPYHLGFGLTEQTYSGVWRQGSDAYYLWVNADWNSFMTKWQQLASQNLRLVDLKITRVNGAERYHGVWREGTGGYYLWVNADWNSFMTKWQQLAQQGLRLVDLEVTNFGGVLRYSGVWLPGNDGYYLWVNADWNSFVAKWQQLAQQNLRLIDLRIVQVGGADRYFGVWREGTGGYYLWVNADWNSFMTKWQQLAQQGLRLVDLEITDTGSARRYSGVWLPGTDAYYLWVGTSWQNFRAKWEELAAQNLRLIDLDVVPPGGAQSAPPSALRVPEPQADVGGMAEVSRAIAHIAAAGRRTDLTQSAPSRLGVEEDGDRSGGDQVVVDSAAGLGGGEIPRAAASMLGTGAAGMGGGGTMMMSAHSVDTGLGGGEIPRAAATVLGTGAAGMGGGEIPASPSTLSTAAGDGGGRLA